jgi:hypothetical protein
MGRIGRRTGLGVALLLTVACASRPPAVDRPVSVDGAVRLVTEAQAYSALGRHATARRLFELVVDRFASSPVHDQALFGLARGFVLAENPDRDFERAHIYFDRLAREHPNSAYAADAAAWRDLLAAYLTHVQELELQRRDLDRTREEVEQGRRDLDRTTQELERERRDLDRTRQDVERRRRDLDRLTHDLERQRRDLERVTQELERRRRDLELLRQIDVEMERQRRP